MTLRNCFLTMAALVLSPAIASAATFTYDFKAESNEGGLIGESIYDVFTTAGVFAGPNLQITASAGADAAFPYFDNREAGVGVCKVPLPGSQLNVSTGGADNACDPSSDDGLTALNEVLTFTAIDPIEILSIRLNSNHDDDDILDSIWSIGGEILFSEEALDLGNGDIEFDLGLILQPGESFDLFGIATPNSYLSAFAVASVASVPVPATFILLGAAIGGLGLMRRRQKT